MQDHSDYFHINLKKQMLRRQRNGNKMVVDSNSPKQWQKSITSHELSKRAKEDGFIDIERVDPGRCSHVMITDSSSLSNLMPGPASETFRIMDRIGDKPKRS
jgi:hypothetical protein